MIATLETQSCTAAEMRARAIERRKRLGMITPAVAHAPALRAPERSAHAPAPTAPLARVREAPRPEPVWYEPSRTVVTLDDVPYLADRLTDEIRTGLTILDNVADRWSVQVSDIKSSVRRPSAMAARREAHYLLRLHLGWDWSKIARFLGSTSSCHAAAAKSAQRHADLNGLVSVGSEVRVVPWVRDPNAPPILVMVGPRASGRMVIESIAAAHGITVNDLKGVRRIRPLILARHEAMYVLVIHLGVSTTQAGRLLRRDHTTVLSGIRAHARRNGLTTQRSARTLARLALGDVQDAVHA